MNKLIIGILIILILLIILFLFNNSKFEDNKKEIVIARYAEDLSWLNDPMFDGYSIKCYNKGSTDVECKKCDNLIKIDNIASGEYAFIYHIVNNYDNLSPITVFLTGSCMDDGLEKRKKIEITTKIFEILKSSNDTILIGNRIYTDIQKDLYSSTFTSWCGTNKKNLIEKNNNCELIPAKIRPFGKWYAAKFGKMRTTHTCEGGNFAASKIDIHNRPKSFYQDLLNELTIHKSPNLEVSHYIERSWEAILKPKQSSLYKLNNTIYN